MVVPYLGEIRMMAFDFAPRYWAACDGQLLQIAQNRDLFVLFSTRYGGDGTTTFGLPDLRSAAAVHRGQFSQGAKGGEDRHLLSEAEIPTGPGHTHALQGSTDAADQSLPEGMVFAATSANAYATYDATKQVTLPGPTVQTVGGVPHENMAPYQAVTFCVALSGTYPRPA
jgi:microcystin-dependent protein